MLRHVLLVLVLSTGLATASAPPGLRQPPSPAERAYAASIGWTAAADQLGRALAAAYQPGHGGAAGTVGNADFQSWLLLYRWSELLARPEPNELARFLARFIFQNTADADRANARLTLIPPGMRPPANLQPVSADRLRTLIADPDFVHQIARDLLPTDFTPVNGKVADALRPDFLAALTSDDVFLHAFFENLSEFDYAPAALKILQDIWSEEPKKWPAYRNLALALALVRDQRAPSWWPHNQVRPSDFPRSTAAPLDEFRSGAAANESQRLLNDLRAMPVGDLKFVVDAPVASSELEWAQKNIRFPRADFGRAFSSINYRHDRLETSAYTWSDGPYTLAAIRERGGICVDQAYFAMVAGKALGLPTLYFSGQGTDGGHAWFGYLKGANRWDMDCGRYENQNYAVGEALDPQTWLPINDHELAALAQSFRRTPACLASQDDIAMAGLFARLGDSRRELAALDSAIAIFPRNDLAWVAKGEFLVRTDADPAAQRAFHEAAILQFANNNDLKVTHQKALAALARRTGDETSAQTLESKIISQNRRDRSDLSVNAAATRLSGLVDEGKLDDAIREYRSLVSRLARTGGGNLFYNIVAPFARSLAAKGDPASARRALEFARTALKPEPGGILDRTFSPSRPPSKIDGRQTLIR